jgi:hypothetical protein
MSDYTAQKALFDVMNVFNQPRKHWSIGVGWKITESLEMVIGDRTRVNLQKPTSFLCPVTRSIDNQLWLLVIAFISMLGEQVCHLL